MQETIEKRGVIPGIFKGYPSDFGSFAAFCLGLLSFMGFLDDASKEEELRLLASMKAKKKKLLARRIYDFSTLPQEAPAWDTADNKPAVSYAPVKKSNGSSQQTTTAQPITATITPSQYATPQQEQRVDSVQHAAPPANSYGSAAPPRQQPAATSPAFSYPPAMQPQQPATAAVNTSSGQQQYSYSAPLPAAAAAVLSSASTPPPPPPPRPASRAEAVTSPTETKRSYAVSQAAPASRGRTPGGSYLESLSPY